VRVLEKTNEYLLRQLLHIRQHSSVTEYVEHFSQLVDQLNAYNLPSDPLYYTTKFIDGLRSDIKSIVLIQRPRDLDTAYVLAQLQEEVAKTTKQRDLKRSDRAFSKAVPNDDRPTMPVSKPPAIDDKLAALYAYRKAKGLCYKCGLAYTRGHKCVDIVQLHLVDEIWQFLQLPGEVEPPTSDPAEELQMLSLSLATTSRKDTPKTIRFLGGDIEILVLLDSGSSASFLSTQVASTLPEVRPLSPPLRVQVTDGAQLTCSEQLLNVTWYIGGFPFSSDLKVLPLSNYDLILGMDWLFPFSPMWIHCNAKCLVIRYLHSKIKLWVWVLAQFMARHWKFVCWTHCRTRNRTLYTTFLLNYSSFSVIMLMCLLFLRVYHHPGSAITKFN
jgi:hypothetical protein